VELRQVETFRAVANELSFSRAAAKLGYVQSSVSSQVASLEQELGAPLFDRLGRTIALTEAGRVMLSYSERLLGLARESKEAVADAGVGSGEITGALSVMDGWTWPSSWTVRQRSWGFRPSRWSRRP
jgi:DNA-binding transcriptional LysR family regulator